MVDCVQLSLNIAYSATICQEWNLIILRFLISQELVIDISPRRLENFIDPSVVRGGLDLWDKRNGGVAI